MAIPPDEIARGCSAHLPQPVGEDGRQEARSLVRILNDHNNGHVVYRTGYNDEDILRHVFRWSPLHPEQVFNNGFVADAQGNTDPQVYWNIHRYVTGAGPPLQPHQNNFGFVSTTSSSRWTPQTPSFRDEIVCRYEIYAPGGIWVAQTLANYEYPGQQEVIFVRGINRQYIRSAQLFLLVASDNRGHLTRQRVDEDLLINPYFDPASHPTRRLLDIQCPIDYCMINNMRVPLNIVYTDPQYIGEREKRSASSSTKNPSATSIWYAEKVTGIDGYIDAAFQSYYTNEAYLFMGDSYVLVDYSPNSTNDKVLNGPLLIGEGFPSLSKTIFADHGIDCAFQCYTKEAYIFSENLCAKINYAPHTTDDKILEGPKTIVEMFPYLEPTGFGEGIDAAFESTTRGEAYIFKGNQYVLIDYHDDRKVVGGPKKITDGFACLKGTIFESGVDAAFASHRFNEAYLFKGDEYVLINFSPGSKNDYIINGGPKKITPNWPSLAYYLPHKNHGLDVPS